MTARVKVRFLAATSVALAMLAGGLAVPAGAAAPTVLSESDCEALLELGDEVPDTSGSTSFDPDQADAVAEGFEATADKIDDRKLRKSLLVLADVYADIGDAKNEAQALAVTVKAGKKFGKALGKWSKATIDCAVTGITLPSDVTLPRNVTLPTDFTVPSR